MKGNILTFHDEKSLAATSDTLGRAAMNAAFFMFTGIMWLLLLPVRHITDLKIFQENTIYEKTNNKTNTFLAIH